MEYWREGSKYPLPPLDAVRMGSMNAKRRITAGLSAVIALAMVMAPADAVTKKKAKKAVAAKLGGVCTSVGRVTGTDPNILICRRNSARKLRWVAYGAAAPAPVTIATVPVTIATVPVTAAPTTLAPTATTAPASTTSTSTTSTVPAPPTRFAPAAVTLSTCAYPAANELILNGDAELGAAVADNTTVAPATNWTVLSGRFTPVRYGPVPGLVNPAVHIAPVTPGNAFFAGGPVPANSPSQAKQTISLVAFAAAIDSGKMKVTLSACLGGAKDELDDAKVTIDFLTPGGLSLGAGEIGPVSNTDRGNATALLPRGLSGVVPVGARSVDVFITMTRKATTTAAPYVETTYNDGYADKVSLGASFS